MNEPDSAEPNPYEPPQTLPQVKVAVELGPPARRVSVLTIVLVSLALCLGVISIFPLVGIFFLICAIPIFVRFTQQPAEGAAARTLAGGAASVGVGLSVIAAGLGACYGTCHATGFLAFVSFYPRHEDLLNIAVWIAPTIGVIAAGFTIFMLWPLTRKVVEAQDAPPAKAQTPPSTSNAFADREETP